MGVGHIAFGYDPVSDGIHITSCLTKNSIFRTSEWILTKSAMIYFLEFGWGETKLNRVTFTYFSRSHL